MSKRNALLPRTGVASYRGSRYGTRRLYVGATWFRPVLLAIGLIALPLRAHDLYSSWAETFVRPDRLELTLTLAHASALRLLPDAQKRPPITPENFGDYVSDLREAAPRLFEITAGGQLLTLRATEVKISGDADITFQLSFAPARSSPLRFVVHYLFHQVDGHTGTIVVNNQEGRDLGWSPVSVDQPVFELKLPEPAQRKAE